MSSYSTIAYDEGNVLFTHVLSPGVYAFAQDGQPIRFAMATIDALFEAWKKQEACSFHDPLWGDDLEVRPPTEAWIRVRGGSWALHVSPKALRFLVEEWPRLRQYCSDEGEHLDERDL